MSGRIRQPRWHSIVAVFFLLVSSPSIAPLALSYAPEQYDCGCIGSCDCGYGSRHSSCARERTPGAPAMRSCRSDEAPILAATAYEVPEVFALFAPASPADRLEDGAKQPEDIGHLPETPPPRLSS